VPRINLANALGYLLIVCVTPENLLEAAYGDGAVFDLHNEENSNQERWFIGLNSIANAEFIRICWLQIYLNIKVGIGRDGQTVYLLGPVWRKSK